MVVEVKIEGTKELSNALVEAFSPVTEALGTLGDRVRIYRQISLLRSIERAKSIAKAEGLKLTEPPLKFLVPYLEDCSLESPDDSTLIEMWARLLVSASTNHKSEQNLFIRILKELTASEAHLFRYIASPETHNHCDTYRHPDDVESDWNTTFVSIALRDAIKSLGGINKLETKNLLSKLEEEFRSHEETAGAIIYYFSIAKGVPGKYPH